MNKDDYIFTMVKLKNSHINKDDYMFTTVKLLSTRKIPVANDDRLSPKTDGLFQESLKQAPKLSQGGKDHVNPSDLRQIKSTQIRGYG